MFWILIIVVLLAAYWCVRTSNNFKKKEIKVQESLSGIEVALTRRFDMLTKLLEVTKSYMNHEDEMFTKVIRMRQGMNVQEMNQANREMSEVSGRIFAVAENYPELLSSKVFVELQEGIEDAEAHLQAARRLYNASISDYNTSIAMFPASLLAKGRTAKEFFVAEEEKTADVKINL